MSGRERSRREFLIQSLTGAGAVWATANYGGIAEAAAFAQQSARSTAPPAFTFFTAAQAADVDAMAAQIIPADSTPGAREAHVVVFIDRILSTFEKEAQAEYTKGLTELTAETRRRSPSDASFAALSSADQIALLTAIEKTPFFNLVRTHTVTGFFAAPVHGGNAGKVGWVPPSATTTRCPTPPAAEHGRNTTWRSSHLPLRSTSSSSARARLAASWRGS